MSDRRCPHGLCLALGLPEHRLDEFARMCSECGVWASPSHMVRTTRLKGAEPVSEVVAYCGAHCPAAECVELREQRSRYG